MRVVFIDPVCPEPVSWRDPQAGALGGTEATLLMVAEGLASRGWGVTVAQHNRAADETSPAGVRYVGYDHKAAKPACARADLVVLLRCFKLLKRVRGQFPDAALHLWMHCFPGSRWKGLGQLLESEDARVVAVSDTLAREMVEVAARTLPRRRAEERVTRIYNPVADGLRPGGSGAFDPHKLVFFSSPHKGLAQVLEAFRAVARRLPEARLFVADPGYFRAGPVGQLPAGVVALGALPQHAVHRHVREALCVFYPQTRFRETFGLVFAEANALGTPVLAHPTGAAAEVLGAGGLPQLVDCADVEAVAETVVRWSRGGRPAVSCPSAFRLSSVLDAWQALPRRGRSPVGRPVFQDDLHRSGGVPEIDVSAVAVAGDGEVGRGVAHPQPRQG